ncbi:MAG TPA: DMT family transporter [Candidatus Dormibacteraeota bacterium]|nr:DMT family transporter [Candidatus Dormibacteraeota bacterium]
MNRVIDRYSMFFVALAATLWATDAYFRNQLVQHLTANEIVVAEDALIALFLVPVLLRSWGEVRKLNARGWVAIILIAAGAQAVATILFTKSFSYGLYSETFVLQQTQPLIAITLAWIVLGERRRPWFWPAVALAVVAVYLVLQAPNITLEHPFAPITSLPQGRVEAGLFALGAAALWASGTVLGRYALGSISFWSMTALRFTVALPVLIAIVLVSEGGAGFTHYTLTDFFPNFLGIALVSGLFALLLYYRALAKTPASLATIAEMAYPVAATLIASGPPPWGFHQPIYPAQILGTVLLLVVIGVLGFTKERTSPPVKQEERAPVAA